MKNQFFLIPAHGRRQAWEVVGFNGRGRWLGTWACDGEDIAKLVMKRLRKGKHPGWAAKDLRMGITS
jgi:hypothetical protein